MAAETVLPEGEVLAAAVLLHPHPLMGGNMAAPVPDHLFRLLPAEGIAVMRFDFRGAGSSGGEFGGGIAEATDTEAAIDHLATSTGLPVWLVGWSFGADVSLQVVDPRVAGWVCIAAPLRTVSTDLMLAADDPRPIHLMVAEHDQFTTPEQIAESSAGWVNTRTQVIPGTDHFLAGRLGAVALATTAILESG